MWYLYILLFTFEMFVCALSEEHFNDVEKTAW